MKIKDVKLTTGEIAMAQAIGLLRRNECIRGGFQQDNRSRDRHASCVWDIDIEGAGAEISFCKYKGLYWEGTVNTFKKADVLDNIEIRHTTLEGGRLIIRKKDFLDRYYVLVIGRIPDYKIVGYIKGSDGCRDEWKADPNGKEESWFVPQSSLKDVDFIFYEGRLAFTKETDTSINTIALDKLEEMEF